MSIKMSLGLSKKIGLPAYSSVGASCQLECELERSVLEDADCLRQETQRLFGLCRQAVEEQLTRETTTNGETRLRVNGSSLPANSSAKPASHDRPPAREPREAEESLSERGLSERQLAFLQDLASQIDGLGIRRLPAVVAFQFDKNLTELSSAEASRLIGLLRQVRAGELALDGLLDYDQPER